MSSKQEKLVGLIDKAHRLGTTSGLKAAINVVDAEARWHWELDARGSVGAQIVAQRMALVSRTLAGFVERLEQETPAPDHHPTERGDDHA